MKKGIKISKIALIFCFTFLVFAPYKALAATNNYPIIMVHGLFGWGNDELFGINYWGGLGSIKEDLTAKGYEVYTPTVGSVSSNWDRACELYAYIKGGTVDYGEVHSKKCGHARYGRTYPGVYPKFGTTSSSNEISKIHLVGHSMGGETVRVLTQLLEKGDSDEQLFSKEGNVSPLFIGGKNWIDSVTTIATPEDGTAEAYNVNQKEPVVHQFFAALAAETGVFNSDNPCFDFRLDQWGLKKEPNESFVDYDKKVLKSNLWKKTKDLSVWDLTPEGARELNKWVKAQSDVYYFSYACQDTHKELLKGYQVPNVNMNPLMLKSSTYIGRFTNNKSGEVPVDSSWWPNDGVVSVISAISPHVGSDDKEVTYNGQAQKGVWNYMGLTNGIDHIEVVGMKRNREKLMPMYYDLAKMLTNLPK